VAAQRQAFATATMPNALIVAHAKPDGPRLPSTRDAAADEPKSVVQAASPLSNKKEGSVESEEVVFSAAKTKNGLDMKL